MKKFMAFMLVLVLGLVLYGCDNGDIKDDDPVEPKTIEVTGHKATMVVGDSIQLSANITPTNATQTVTWSSSDKEVATVDTTGKVVAIGQGTVSITVVSTAKSTINKTVNILVTEAVVEIEPETIEITSGTGEVLLGETLQLTANVSPKNAPQTVTWSSSDAEVAVVSNTGLVTGIKEGTVSITAVSTVDEEIKATVEIKVVDTAGVLPTELNVLEHDNEMLIGDTMTLVAEVLPAEASQVVAWTTDTTDVLTVDEETGLVTAVGEGNGLITVIPVDNPRLYREIYITVKRPVVYETPTHVIITASLSEFGVGTNLELTATVYPVKGEETDGARQEVLWSSSNEEVATVDEKGIVHGLAEGTAVITVTVVEDPSLSFEFEVQVVIHETGGGVAEPPTDISIAGVHTVEEGRQIKLTSTVQPAGASQGVVWSSMDPSIATVDQQGRVTGLKSGSVFIEVASRLDFNVRRLVEITVIVPKVLPERTDLKGYVIEIMTAPHVPHEHDPYHIDYPGVDRSEKIAAWEEVEQNFNTTLEVVVYPEGAPWGPNRIKWLNDQAALGDAKTDIYVSTTDWILDFATAGTSVDVTEFYDTYGRNAMDPGVVAASSYQGSLYALPTGMNVIRPYHGLVFNVNKLEEVGLDNPAGLFNRGEWTWSTFENYVIDAASRLKEDETVLSGKPAGLYYGMVNAAGVALVDTTRLELNFLNSFAIAAGTMIQKLYAMENVWGSNHWDAENPTFNDQKSIFQVAEYWFLKDDGRFSKTMWGEGSLTRFGWVPFPYPDQIQKQDTRVSYQGGAIYQMTTGRDWNHPAGVTYEDIYRAFTEMMLGTTERMMESVDFDEEVIMRQAAEAKLDDAESINAIIYFKDDKVIFDPYYTVVNSANENGAGPMIDSITVSGQDYFSVVASFSPAFQTALQDLYGS